jgi:hypothetical protein
MSTALDVGYFAGVLRGISARCHAAHMSGGIAARHVLEGATVPDGWVHDVLSQYWVPSLDVLDAHQQRAQQ